MLGQVLAIDPNHADGLNHMGILAYRAGQMDLARSFFARATAADPDLAEAHFNLGLALQSLSQPGEAAEAFRQTIALTPGLAPAHLALGNVQHAQGRLDEAAAAFAEAVALTPGYADAHMNLGNVRREQRRLTEALSNGRRAVELNPDSAVGWRNLALSHQDGGLAEDAVACFDRALALAPDFAEAQSGRLFCLNYLTTLPAQAIFEAHQRWGGRCAGRAPPTPAAFANVRDPERRLRVGYVSGDLHTHPAGYFLRSVLEHRDPAAIEVFCYSNGVRSDAMTDALRASTDEWRSIHGAPDGEVEALIRSDTIDILVDLSGHTAANRLPLFNRRPAPVQATWLGYVSTTGLPAIDYVISDADTAPPGSEALFTEALVRLPHGRFCYAPPNYAPQPELSLDRPPTFGSFNDVLKLNAEVIETWASILKATPDARLRLKWMAFADEAVTAQIAAAFDRHGVDPERIAFSGYAPHAVMLAEYRHIDVALDPFPFGGGLTTCEALWMGVPVVTLPQERPASRQSLSFLNALGLGEFAATSTEDYIARAVDLIRDRDRIRDLRQSLRRRMAASPLCDGRAFTPTLETAYRQMWRRWCAGKPAAGFDVPREAG